MSNNNSGIKFMLGLFVGSAIGAAIAYLSDESRRNQLIDDMSDTADKVKSNVKDAYYEGRIRARKAGRDLSHYVDDLKSDAEDIYSTVKDSASQLGNKAKDTAQKVADLTEEELEDLKAEAKEQKDKLTEEAKKKVNKD